MSASATDTPSAPVAPDEPSWVRETRRVSDPSRAQQLWDAIVAVRSQKQIPAIVRISRYMNRFYQVKKGKICTTMLDLKGSHTAEWLLAGAALDEQLFVGVQRLR